MLSRPSKLPAGNAASASKVYRAPANARTAVGCKILCTVVALLVRSIVHSLAYSTLMDEYTGIFGYSHLLGGFAGGQAEYVRVPLGDVNLLKIPDNVPDEKGRCCPFTPDTDT